MTTFRLKYVHKFRDRHGKMRYYVRKKGIARSALPGHPGSAVFMQAYRDALEGTPVPPPSRYGNGTIGALWTAYCRSVAFANLSTSSRRTYRNIVGPLLEQHGHRSASGMSRQHARQIVEQIAHKTPGMANLTIAVLRLLFNFAVQNNWRLDNPCIGLKKYKGGEHETWTDEELAQFEARWPIGTRERLVFDLLLYTAQRGGDVVSWKHSDVVGGVIRVTQEKTKTSLVIPIHPLLARSIAAVPKLGSHIVVDPNGAKVQRQTLTRIIRVAVQQAALPASCVAHGLRKAALRRLAERGASEKELAAMSGHRSLAEVQRYTKAADQEKLARAALERLSAKKPEV